MADLSFKSKFNTLRDCEQFLLKLAHSGKSRPLFFREAIRAVAEATGVCEVHMVLFDGHRRFHVEHRTGQEDESTVDIRTDDSLPGGANLWTDGSSPDLEELCRTLMAPQHDADRPWFTESGDLCIDDLATFSRWNLIGSGDKHLPGLHVSAESRSLLIMPVEGTRKRLGLIQFESDEVGFFGPRLREPCSRLVHTLGFAADLRGLQIALRERVKELTCLYDIAHLVAHAETSLVAILQSAVEKLPPGWLYPEIAAARIVLNNRSFATAGVDHLVQTMRADIVVNYVKEGYVEVGYTETMPSIDEGPFLHEERHLIDMVAGELAFVVEQKAYAEEKQKLQQQLRHADRLATIGQLAAGVAHELNEPLSTIMGFAQLASKQPGMSEEAVRDMNKIVSAALHARDIIRELLVFAREAKPVKLTFKLNDLIRDGLFFLESRFVKAGISLVCNLDDTLPSITADRSQILQVLTNLAVNAVQAMPNGGRLEITTSLDKDMIQLVIADTGCGIDKQIQKDIFHPFFTTKDVNEGTGLGLSVVHGIIASHGGSIDVDSQPGVGTKFRIRLPLGVDRNGAGV
jgi:signal transduction histidine kinase